MDALTHLAHQRLNDLHATAEAIRLERSVTSATAETPSGSGRGPIDPAPALAVVVGERGGPCEPEAKAA